jgi:hypothetical protein
MHAGSNSKGGAVETSGWIEQTIKDAIGSWAKALRLCLIVITVAAAVMLVSNADPMALLISMK